ncbi:MAG: dihydroneopterin aldolase [Saprospiraceae bacterium]
MALIAIEGMKFHAFHGVYEAERKIGTDYMVDVYVQTVIAAASASDQLEATINYESVYLACKMEMSQPKQLIESVLNGIFQRMKKQFPGMMALKVRVRKMNPPLGGQVASAWVEDEQTFMQQCPRCSRSFVNYNPGDCWARHPNLHPATRETLTRQFGGKCLCDDCLKFYAG